jgi:YD repeat-containing protein
MIDGTAAWLDGGIRIRRPGKRPRVKVIEPSLPEPYYVDDFPALAWSPDGEWLAFDTIREPGSHADATAGGVFVVHRSGRPARRVAPDGVLGATWSPNGRRIAAHDLRGGISIFDVRTGKRIGDLNVPSSSAAPAWSPRAELVAFDNGKNLFLIGADGRGLKRLTVSRGAKGWQRGAAWSPDGRRIAFTLSNDGVCSAIGVMNADGSRLRVYHHRGP